MLILLLLLLVQEPVALSAQEQRESRWYWRAGVTASINTYLQARHGGEGPTYDVSLSERYGKYHGPVSAVPPLSVDIGYRLFKFLDVSAGFSWVPMWGKVYDRFDAMEGQTVLANNIFLIPSLKVNYIHRADCSLYSSVGYGVGLHFNRSDSNLIGTDHWGYHNDFILDKGKNHISRQLELILLGFSYRHLFWEGGFGSKFWGYGSRFGVQFVF